MEQISANKIFGGQQLQYQHVSEVLNCDMQFSIYLPPQVGEQKLGEQQAEQQKVPLIYWLSGLTCTDQNFVQKAAAQRYAAEHGVAIVAPDTSPRGEQVADDPDQNWDFGLGAGFYVNATQEPYAQNYRMYDYVASELPRLLSSNFPVDAERQSIMGHSMGGHGALIIALKNPGVYKSVSAFAPICNPIDCPWGQKAFGNYLGKEQSRWAEYDACELIHAGTAEKLDILVDQGAADDFLQEQLKPQALIDACQKMDQPLELRMREGYDHSYFFIASFIGEHIAFHADRLNAV